jgi:uncharacterized YigZ family protein
MKGIISYASRELDIKNSRFLAEAFPVSTQEEARALLKSQKEKYFDANHVVHAFVIGPTGGILGCSDDGEPSGTAGRPALDVLKGSGITGIMVTVTRWFGGTLLGTGGLVKAYGDSVKAVLAEAPASDLVEVRDFSFAVSYELHDRVRHDLAVQCAAQSSAQGASFGVTVTGEEFGTDVTITGTIPESSAEAFCARVVSLTNGRSRVALSKESRIAPAGK